MKIKKKLDIPGLIPDIISIIFSYIEEEYKLIFVFVSKNWKRNLGIIKKDDYYSFNNKLYLKANSNVMIWMRKNKSLFSNGLMTGLLKSRNYDRAKLLLDIGCQFNKWTFPCASYVGDISHMEWLLENGCQLDESTFTFAASKGNIKTMKWLKDKGCPWNEKTFQSVLNKKDDSIIQWTVENGCPHNENQLSLFFEKLKF